MKSKLLETGAIIVTASTIGWVCFNAPEWLIFVFAFALLIVFGCAMWDASM